MAGGGRSRSTAASPKSYARMWLCEIKRYDQVFWSLPGFPAPYTQRLASPFGGCRSAAREVQRPTFGAALELPQGTQRRGPGVPATAGDHGALRRSRERGTRGAGPELDHAGGPASDVRSRRGLCPRSGNAGRHEIQEPQCPAAAAGGGSPEKGWGRLRRRVRSPGLPLDPSRPEADREADLRPPRGPNRRQTLHPDLRGQSRPLCGLDDPRLRHRRQDRRGLRGRRDHRAHSERRGVGATSQAARTRRRRAGSRRGWDGIGLLAVAAADPRPGSVRDDPYVRAP